MNALIVLEDGSSFTARAFAGQGEVFGEMVFNTSMTGYQEILTDPSYTGQIVTLTYPLIGNYGVNEEDLEAGRPKAAALVVGEASRIASNWRSTRTLADYLNAHGIMGVDQVDTRAVTLHIRSRGTMRCVISTADLNAESLLAKVLQSEGMAGRDLASLVSTRQAFTWPGPYAAQQGFPTIAAGVRAYDDVPADRDHKPFRVAVLDCGIKLNQLRLFAQRGCTPTVFPIETPASEVLAGRFDGFFISNGPGDPATAGRVVQNIRAIAESGLATFGICFGHQLLGQAFGGKTFKLKFGHRGGNQPVMDLTTGKVEITSQNHGFCVDKDALDPALVETTHINLNDQTSEGLRHKKLPAFSVQYHPEACPGPHDSTYLFNRFIRLMRERS